MQNWRPGWSMCYCDSLRTGRSWDRIADWPRYSAPVQTGPVTHPASCTMETGSFPGLKRPECVYHYTPPFNPGLRMGGSAPSCAVCDGRGVSCCTVHVIWGVYALRQILKWSDEVDRGKLCSTKRREKKCLHNFCLKIRKKQSRINRLELSRRQ